MTETLGQGTLEDGIIMVHNRVPPDVLDAPIFEMDCMTPLEGDAYRVQAYIGSTRENLAAAGAVHPFREGAAAGYFSPASLWVEGRRIYVQLRAWETASGNSYEQALASGGKFGASNVFPIEPASPTAPPANLIGLESFCLVPEPGTMVLAGCGLVVFLAMGRFRKRRMERGTLGEPTWGTWISQITPNP